MTAGERGPAGDHGQAGDPGRAGTPGAAGAKGEKGERGINPWVVRQANFAYALLVVGIFGFLLLSQYQERQNDKRAEAEAVATDEAFCALAADSRSSINANRNAIRTLRAAVRQSFELVRPAPDATAAQRARTLEFRRQILAKLEAVKVDGNLSLPDCSGIGNGDFSLQDAITKATTTTTIPP